MMVSTTNFVCVLTMRRMLRVLIRFITCLVLGSW